jgi:hypothetical protein
MINYPNQQSMAHHESLLLKEGLRNGRGSVLGSLAF